MTQFSKLLFFLAFYAYCGICEIRNLRLFRKRFEIFEKFQNWLIKGKKLMGPYFEVFCEIIIFSCILCILRNSPNSQFAIISQTVWDIWKISKLAYQRKKIKGTFSWRNLRNYYFFLLLMHIAEFAKFAVCNYFANGLRYLKNFKTGLSREKN